MDGSRTGWLVSTALTLALFAPPSSARATDLVWRVESGKRAVVEESGSSESINPASLVKLATTLWAVESLGPQHRFETAVAIRGSFDPDSGVLTGDLYLRGGKDPDFHVENVFLVIQSLRRLGLRTVSGDLVVDANFWMGWEHGSAGREANALVRNRQMAVRLVSVLDGAKWTSETRAAWKRFAEHYSLSLSQRPGITIKGTARAIRAGESPGAEVLVVHRSRVLVEILRRFNIHSNNDIERLEATLGSAPQMAAFFRARWGAEESHGIEFETTSGLGRNRMTLKQIVHLLVDLEQLLFQHGLRPSNIAPVMNCEASTLTKLFRRIAAGTVADGMVGKTGTLTTTDGGISALGGWMDTAEGPLRFVVAAPGSGRALWPARQATELWLEGVLERAGGVVPGPRCPPGASTSDDGAQVALVPTG
jgi:D-alanyl-D-alanine carboxypeptidase/D-alanyl-D-alanine-endopeptidase (penicillin-binding protein 4)